MSILVRLREIEKLPTLPEIMMKVQALINSDESDAASLAHIIKQDPALSSTILKTANSAYYNFAKRRISSITEAIARIGFNEVLKITLAMSVIEQFANTKSMIGYASFWRHSLTAAGLTTIIADVINDEDLQEYRQDLFLAGLLHDIGILIYDQFFHEEFTEIINCTLNEEKTYLAAENIISPKETHGFIGGALLEIWKLALPIIVSVRNHHTPQKAPENFRKIVSIVSLAEYILCNGRVGSFEGIFEEIDESVWELTGISPNDIESLFLKAEAEAGKSDILLHTGAGHYQPLQMPHDDHDHTPLRPI